MKAMHVCWMDTLSLLLLIFFIAPVGAHSWVEQLTVIAPNGTFVGDPGFPRGNVLRSDPAFNDDTMTYLTPPNGRANQSQILPTDKLCKDTQRKQVQSKNSPRLQASPGAAIALRFQENGHVTLPQNQLGKPPNRGTVYVYGTTEPKEDEKLLDVHRIWNKEGTGGDKRGVLLSEQNFDDGRCYQINSGDISQHRQSTYPHEANQNMGADLWCQQDIALPSKAPAGKPYTLYWVWDWPTEPGVDPGLSSGKQEIYTTCIDVDIVDRPLSRVRVPVSYIDDQSLNNAAIPSQFAEIFGQGSSLNSPSMSSIPRPSRTPSSIPTEFPTATVTSFVTVVMTVYPSKIASESAPEPIATSYTPEDSTSGQSTTSSSTTSSFSTVVMTVYPIPIASESISLSIPTPYPPEVSTSSQPTTSSSISSFSHSRSSAGSFFTPRFARSARRW